MNVKYRVLERTQGGDWITTEYENARDADLRYAEAAARGQLVLIEDATERIVKNDRGATPEFAAALALEKGNEPSQGIEQQVDGRYSAAANEAYMKGREGAAAIGQAASNLPAVASDEQVLSVLDSPPPSRTQDWTPPAHDPEDPNWNAWAQEQAFERETELRQAAEDDKTLRLSGPRWLVAGSNGNQSTHELAGEAQKAALSLGNGATIYDQHYNHPELSERAVGHVVDGTLHTALALDDALAIEDEKQQLAEAPAQGDEMIIRTLQAADEIGQTPTDPRYTERAVQASLKTREEVATPSQPETPPAELSAAAAPRTMSAELVDEFDVTIARARQSLEFERKRLNVGVGREKEINRISDRYADAMQAARSAAEGRYPAERQAVIAARSELAEAQEKGSGLFGRLIGGKRIEEAQQKLTRAQEAFETKVEKDPLYAQERREARAMRDNARRDLDGALETNATKMRSLDALQRARFEYGPDKALDALQSADRMRQIDTREHFVAQGKIDTGYLKQTVEPIIAQRHAERERAANVRGVENREVARARGIELEAADHRFAGRLRDIADRPDLYERHLGELAAKTAWHQEKIVALNDLGGNPAEVQRHQQALDKTTAQLMDVGERPEAYQTADKILGSRIKAGFEGYQRDELVRNDERVAENHRVSSRANAWSMPTPFGDTAMSPAAPKEAPDAAKFLPDERRELAAPTQSYAYDLGR